MNYDIRIIHKDFFPSLFCRVLEVWCFICVQEVQDPQQI